MPDREEVAAVPLAEERVATLKRGVESGRVRAGVLDSRREVVPAQIEREDTAA